MRSHASPQLSPELSAYLRAQCPGSWTKPRADGTCAVCGKDAGISGPTTQAHPRTAWQTCPASGQVAPISDGDARAVQEGQPLAINCHVCGRRVGLYAAFATGHVLYYGHYPVGAV